MRFMAIDLVASFASERPTGFATVAGVDSKHANLAINSTALSEVVTTLFAASVDVTGACLRRSRNCSGQLTDANCHPTPMNGVCPAFCHLLHLKLAVLKHLIIPLNTECSFAMNTHPSINDRCVKARSITASLEGPSWAREGMGESSDAAAMER